MRSLRWSFITLALLAVTAAPAWADATVFLGANTTPANRVASGVAIGTGLLVVGFEFEYSATGEDASAGAPSLTIGSANGLVQTPAPIKGVQPYLTAGGGIYRERLGAAADTGFAPNIGGGVKLPLAGPLRLRVDYRIFRLGSGAAFSPSHRIYVGLNLKF